MSQTQVFTVVGIRAAKGTFDDAKGKSINYDSTNVHILVPYSDNEVAQGAIGSKELIYKIKGSHNFMKYVKQELPAKAALHFEYDFSRAKARPELVSLDFDVIGD